MLAALQTLLQQLTPIRMLDIALVVVLLLAGLHFTRRTRAALLVRGFLLLLVVYLLTSSLPLVHLVIDTLMIGSAVVLGILFQPELRRLLESLGRLTGQTAQLGSQPSSPGEEEDPLEELIQAVRELSQNRTGALIVIEREQPIDPRVFTEKGVLLGAKLSKELLQTIFQPSTLLHDGAVILRDGQIIAAGVILPMSERVASRQLGTRHRAAMGITEQVECFCIVVSEETGSISLAEAGRLERPLTSSKLEELLLQRLRSPQVAKPDAKRLWPNLGLRLAQDPSVRKTLPKE